MGGQVGRVGSLSFGVQGWRGGSCPIRTKGEGVQKLDIFHGCHECMAPMNKCFLKLVFCIF